MTNEEKIEFLRNVLKDNGLDFDDPEINDFFTKKRKKKEILAVIDEKTKLLVKYRHSSLIEPVIKRITPIDFENASYAEEFNLETLQDWYLYRNAGDNQLVFENLREEQFDIIQSLIDENQEYPFNEDLEGSIFNGGSGNHRLLTSIIKQFIELSKAKTKEEQDLVSEEFGMIVFVNLPHREELCDELSDRYKLVRDSYTANEDRIYPKQVCAYRENSFAYAKEKDYLVQYDPETKKYSYEFNLDKFVGSDEELIGYLEVHEPSKDPIMKWQAGGVYYLSCNNQVWKSTKKSEIEKLVPQVQKWFKEGKSTLNNFLEIKDVDTQTYDFQYSGSWTEDQATGKELAKFWDFMLRSRPERVLFHKLKDDRNVATILEENIEKANGYFGGFSLPDFKYENLSSNEYALVKKIFEEYEKHKQNIKIDNVEV